MTNEEKLIVNLDLLLQVFSEKIPASESIHESLNRLRVYVADLAVPIYAKKNITKTDGWISVEDRLPNVRGEYFVHTQHGTRTIGYFSVNLKSFLGVMLRNEKVTHWMQLPEPPKSTKLNE